MGLLVIPLRHIRFMQKSIVGYIESKASSLTHREYTEVIDRWLELETMRRSYQTGKPRGRWAKKQVQAAQSDPPSQPTIPSALTAEDLR